MKTYLISAAIAAMAVVLPASADIYLQLPGDGLKGNAAARGYEQWIALQSVSETLSRPVSSSLTERSSGAAQAGLIEISKLMDPSSPALRTALLAGTNFRDAKIVVTGIGPRGEPVAAYSIALKDVSIANLSAFSDGEIVNESLSLTFRSIEWTVEAAGARGEAVKPPSAKWNFATNKAEF